jgi:Mor family transcriptional regulator
MTTTLGQSANPNHAANDIVVDILQRCLSLAQKSQAPLTEKDIADVEREVRNDWGGDRPFIAKRNGEGHSQRNSRIMRDYLAGERLKLLERRYSLTQRRLLQIIKQK